MSLQSSMAVMKAKLAGNLPQLMALAAQGDVEASFEARKVLKEINDKKEYTEGLANQAAMNSPDTLPVLEQIAGNLDAPQSGIAAYAGGGGPGLDFREGEGILDRAGRRTKEGFMSLVDMLRLPSSETFKGGPPIPATAPTGAQVATPDPATRMKRQQGAGDTPGYTGIAAAGAPVDRDPIARDSGPNGRLAVPAPGVAVAGPPAAVELDDKELLAATEKMTTLQKERNALRDKSRAQLEAAYNEKVKTLTPSTYDKLMSFFAGVQERGGRSAAQALGAGAQKMHGLQKASQAQIAAAKEMYDKADLLEQQARVADDMNDVKGAMELRKQAQVLRRQLAEDKSQAGLRDAQARQADANAEYIKTIKPTVETTKANAAATRAGRVGIAGGAGGKPMTPAQRAGETRRVYDAMKKDLANMEVADSVLWNRAAAQVEQNTSKPTAASPAGPSGVRIKFDAQGNILK